MQLDQPTKDTSTEDGLQLGNFDKLFKELGLPDIPPLDPVSPFEPILEEPSSSDNAFVPSLNLVGGELAQAGSGHLSPSGAQSRDIDGLQGLIDGANDSSNRQASPQARTLNKKERKAQKKLKKALAKKEQAQKSIDMRADSLLETPTPRNEPAFTQTRYSLRSNVGAKIRPATPVQINSPVKLSKGVSSSTKYEAATVKSSQSPVRRPALVDSQPLNSLAQPFIPPLIKTKTDSSQIASLVGVEPVYPSIAPSTLTPPRHTPSQMQPDPTGYFTPQAIGPAGCGNGLIPRTVQPLIQPRSSRPAATPQPLPYPLTPGKGPRAITIRPQVDRHIHFLGQLMYNFPEDRKWLVSPMQLCNEKLSTEGIHVFVDASNIMIGLKDMLRRNGVPPFDLSFDSLALLMERRRPVAKRVSASSHREAAPLPHVTKLVDTSKAVGYENNVKEQVYIIREDSERKKFFKEVDRIGWTKATQRRHGNGSGSDSETNLAAPKTPSTPKWVEQGVDEILHLKMCQSIIDAEVPTTIVLATGDGAEAEHSDGFLAQVERALKKGWKVELLSWKQQINGGYKNKHFRAKWSDKFRIIELDDYLESLIDTP
jgi:hypothetical protein